MYTQCQDVAFSFERIIFRMIRSSSSCGSECSTVRLHRTQALYKHGAGIEYDISLLNHGLVSKITEFPPFRK